jgi:hypothetical protein
MDRYITKKVEQKNSAEFTTLGKAVCVLGKSGIGKTWAVRHALMPCIEITPDILKGKQETIDFLNKISGTENDVILDEYECVNDLVGLREITRLPTNGRFIVISQIPVKFDFEIVTYNFPVLDSRAIKLLFPDASDGVVASCGGDLRRVRQSLDFRSDAHDVFYGPKEFLLSLISRNSNLNPADFCGHPIQEPGNVASILHENYVDSEGDIVRISDVLSMADIIETRVYNGAWDMLPYFNLWGCVLPAVEINHTLGTNLRPGSTWTKYQNACMRSKKLADIVNRIPHNSLCIDSLLLIRKQVENGDFSNFTSYALVPQDLDVMNHLSPVAKIKPKVLASLKKQCVASSASRS